MHARHLNAGQRRCLEPSRTKDVLSAQPDGMCKVAVNYGSRLARLESRRAATESLPEERVDCFIPQMGQQLGGPPSETDSTAAATAAGTTQNARGGLGAEPTARRQNSRMQDAGDIMAGAAACKRGPAAGFPASASVQPRRRKPAHRAAPMRFDKEPCEDRRRVPRALASAAPKPSCLRPPKPPGRCTPPSRQQPAMQPASARHPRCPRECRRLPPRHQRRNVAELTNEHADQV
ncbi:hypothetical protein PSPO01_10930 [Paraphaeosphaeria sporulosa]